jgi:hypothetical protein
MLLIIVAFLDFVGAPVGNTFSRMREHNADIYGTIVHAADLPSPAPPIQRQARPVVPDRPGEQNTGARRSDPDPCD